MDNKVPISFAEDGSWKKSGFYFMNDGNKNELVITKNDSQYVRGDLLYVKFNDVNIYAPLDCMIIINKSTEVVMIKPYKELSSPEEREYLILLVYYDSEVENIYKGVVGRQTAFDYIKSVVEDIDINRSVILAETVAVKDGISVYDFMKNCISGETPVDNEDGFDIEEYNVDIEEEEE